MCLEPMWSVHHCPQRQSPAAVNGGKLFAVLVPDAGWRSAASAYLEKASTITRNALFFCDLARSMWTITHGFFGFGHGASGSLTGGAMSAGTDDALDSCGHSATTGHLLARSSRYARTRCRSHTRRGVALKGAISRRCGR